MIVDLAGSSDFIGLPGPTSLGTRGLLRRMEQSDVIVDLAGTCSSDFIDLTLDTENLQTRDRLLMV